MFSCAAAHDLLEVHLFLEKPKPLAKAGSQPYHLTPLGGWTSLAHCQAPNGEVDDSGLPHWVSTYLESLLIHVKIKMKGPQRFLTDNPSLVILIYWVK